MAKRLAVDIGGTFVDAIEFDRDTRTTTLEKASTTPGDPTTGVLDSVQKVGTDLEETEAFVHGTTLGINAFLEREGANIGIITNEGFRDIYEIGRTSVERESMFDIQYQKPETLVPRRRRVGVPGRMDANGEVVEPLDEDAVREAADYLVDEHDVDGIAVCFIHSYQNPDHEEQAAAVLEDAHPELSISISSRITREYREYERTSTAVLDAYIKPTFEAYVDELGGQLEANGFDGPFFVTRSGGGALDAENAKYRPVHTILSGPAGGLIGASYVGDVTGTDNLITIDIGGTSLDACVIEDGTPAVEHEADLENFPMMIPVYDIRTIGAGGGSIAWLDGDLLKVGPKSAGADPGPICYGRGGTEPTLTDAALELGYLDPAAFLGGDMDLNVEDVSRQIETKLADPLDMSVTDVSRGIFDVTLANTVGAIREITVEKGLDPRDFTMMSFGGAGGMFVPLIGREMGVDGIMIPQAPSVFSAWGMLMADIVYDFSRTHIETLQDIDLDDLESEFETLEGEARETLDEEGIASEDQQIHRSMEMRYLGQEHTVEVPANGVDSIDELSRRFEEHHQSRYGHTMDDPTEAVHLRVRATGESDKPELERASGDGGVEAAHVGTQTAYCFAEQDHVEFDVYEREPLSGGDVIEGPAIVREPTTTIVFHSDQVAEIDSYGHIIINQESS